MRFYFNSPDQRNADHAYNQKNYEEALTYYLRALETLNRYASSGIRLHTDFYDAFTYAVKDTLETVAVIFEEKADEINTVKTLWQMIPGLVREMEEVYNRELKDKRNIRITKDLLQDCFAKLADACEVVSDEIFETLEDEVSEQSSTNGEDQQSKQQIVAEAIAWMQHAINFRKKSSQSVELSCHLGYLNLLEQHYKYTQDETMLHLMEAYIEDEALLDKEITLPLQKLELFSYVIRIAIVKHQNIEAFAASCQEIYPLVPEEDRDSQIITDLLNFIQLQPSLHVQEASGVSDYEGSDTLTKALETTASMVMSPEIEEDIQSMDCGSIPADIPESLEICSFERTSPVAPSGSVSPQPHNFFVPSCSSEENRLSFFNPVSPTAGQQAQPILPIYPTVQPTVELSHLSDALIAGLNSIIPKEPVPKYLANLLSLTADFFAKAKHPGIPKRNSLIIAFDLYQEVINIQPEHTVAKEQIQKMSHTHKKIISPYQNFGSKPNPLNVRTNRDPRLPKLARNVFDKAIADMTIQLETLLLTAPQHAASVFEGIIKDLGSHLAKGTITHGPRPSLQTSLVETYQQELENKTNLLSSNHT
ncbi:hypothetical protein A8135_10095 [Legionella jamestowniensis]|uniref:Uncharacterized protein n=1 Tax=Legionella jamestowniensis TaxID=455 RepID=A0ABX2XWS7_9GAMM|nr:hypothetical protein [Legionella jamestowniensis]OCH99083.1 hypothetical protein A8135_10095 [Legionella jamestowniensis]